MKSDFSNVEVRTVENNAKVVLLTIISRLIAVKIINKTVMNIIYYQKHYNTSFIFGFVSENC